MFRKWDMFIPLNVPTCTYLKRRCSISFIRENTAWFIVIMIVWVIIITVIIFYIAYKLNDVSKNNNKEKYIWKSNPKKNEKIDGNGAKSLCLESFHSTFTSINTNDSFRRKKETNKYLYDFYDGKSIVGTKHSLKFINEETIAKEMKEYI